MIENKDIKGQVVFDGKRIYIPHDMANANVIEAIEKYSPNKDFYDKIIEHFGSNNQCIVAIEELSELQKEICKHLRDMGNVHNIAEEIADVSIMLEQLQRIFNCRSEVELLKEQKIQRTTERYLKE